MFTIVRLPATADTVRCHGPFPLLKAISVYSPGEGARGLRWMAMVDLFKGFLWLRLIAFLVLLVVVGLVFGIRSLTRGSDAVGLAMLAGVVILTAAAGYVVARRLRA